MAQTPFPHRLRQSTHMQKIRMNSSFHTASSSKKKKITFCLRKIQGRICTTLLENFTNDPTINKPDFDVVEAAGKVIENVDHNAFSRDRMDNENILSLLDATPQTRRFKERLQETFKRYLVALKKYQEENHSQVALAEVQFGENSDYEENNSCFTKEELEELGNLKGLEISFNLDGEEYRLNLSGKIDCISVVNNEEDPDTTPSKSSITKPETSKRILRITLTSSLKTG